jgi:putative CRISPR-associated protein (TIGR02619 family)
MRPILLCTLGTSLFRPNLEHLKAEFRAGTVRDDQRALAEAYSRADWPAVARALTAIPPDDRICGAEINSVASMIQHGHASADCGLFLFHSATPDGRNVALILERYYQARGHSPVERIEVPDLQDEEAKRFRTHGLRNLVRKLCGTIRERSASACAINATGGYKAQIAVAVLVGQALGVPVYYKHELFSEIIAFPPLPVSLDYEIWMQASGMLFDLDGSHELTPSRLYADDWDEKYESLVNRIEIDGDEYLELSPTGQIFHETFRERFRSSSDQILPPAALEKRPPRLEQAGWPGEHPEVRRFLEQVTESIPQVVHCGTHYYHPDLSERTRFRLRGESVEGIFSDGRYCVKFHVQTTAQTPGQRAAVIARLNQWLADRQSSATVKR